MNFRIQEHAYVIQFFLWSHQDSYFLPDTGCSHRIYFQKIWCLMIDGTYLFGFNHVEFIHHVVNNSVVLLFFSNPFLGMVFLPRFFVGCAAAYLVPNSPKILNFSEECPRPLIIQCFNALFRRSTYCLLLLRALSSLVG